MSKFTFELSFKDVKIIKHSLEKRIENDKGEYRRLKNMDRSYLTEEGLEFIKNHEEHKQCLNDFIEEMSRVGYNHGINVFGKKYL